MDTSPQIIIDTIEQLDSCWNKFAMIIQKANKKYISHVKKKRNREIIYKKNRSKIQRALTKISRLLRALCTKQLTRNIKAFNEDIKEINQLANVGIPILVGEYIIEEVIKEIKIIRNAVTKV